jgi:predicted GNAT family acetyltransferase
MSIPGSVRSVPESFRYEFVVEDQVLGIAEYRIGADYVVLHHTHTVPKYRGQGIAEQLVAGALDDLRLRDCKVIPACWYVAQFIDDHPAYQDLLYENEA